MLPEHNFQPLDLPQATQSQFAFINVKTMQLISEWEQVVGENYLRPPEKSGFPQP